MRWLVVGLLLLQVAAAELSDNDTFDNSSCQCCDCTWGECTFNLTTYSEAPQGNRDPKTLGLATTCGGSFTWNSQMKQNGSAIESVNYGFYCPQTSPKCTTTTSSTTTRDPNAPTTTVDPKAPTTTVDPKAPTTTWDPKAPTTTIDPKGPNGGVVVGGGSGGAGSASTTSSSTSTTTDHTPTTTNSTCVDDNENGVCAEYESMRCETAVLTKTPYTVAKILMYVATIWVVLWCIATILVNIMHKNTGHHRWIHLLEELGIIVLWIFMGILNLMMRNNSFCKINSIVIHYFVVMVAACFVFEAIFANSMVHNKKNINGCFPAFLNYIIPILIALAPCLATYFTNKQYYSANGIHCFVFTELTIMYAFVLPVWALLMIASFVSSLGNLACDMTSPEQDHKQCYWAKKSCKILSFLAFWMFFAYLTCMFGSSSQRLWVLIIFLVMSLVFGPLIFVAHTFGHINTSTKWYSPSLPGRFYKPCLHPVPYVPPLVLPQNKPKPAPQSSKPVHRSPPPREPTNAPPPKAEPAPNPDGDEHMVASDLWGWASTKGQEHRRDEVLFAPKPY